MSSVRLAARLRAERRPRVMMRVSGCSFAPSVGLGTEGRVTQLTQKISYGFGVE